MSNASLTTVAYNAKTGILNITGSNLVSTVVLGDFTLKAGTASLTLNASNETISNLTTTGFNITLNATDQALANVFFNTNGISTGGAPYLLNASNGWDGNVNDNIVSQAVTVSGTGPTLSGLSTSTQLLDNSTVHPFGTTIVTDSNASVAETANISFTAANGVLSGNGLSAATVSNGVATYTLSTTGASNLQLLLQGLVFTPTPHQSAVGQTVTTTMTLTVHENFTYNFPQLILSNGVSNLKSIVLDSQGNLWVANRDNSTVEQFSANGVLLQTLSNGISNPNSVTIDKQGDIWVENTGNNTVEQFTASGILQQTISNMVDQPLSFAIDSQGNVWVAHTNNNTLEQFSSSGVLLNTLNNDNGILQPTNLAIDSQSNVWVGNTGNTTLEQFSSSGTLLHNLNIQYRPTSLDIDNQGNVWVGAAGGTHGALLEYSSSGILLHTLNSLVENPSSLAIDSQGNVWVSNNSYIEEFSASGVVLQPVVSVFGYNGVDPIIALTIDNQGIIWAGFNNIVDGFYSGRSSLVSNNFTNNTTQLTVTETPQFTLSQITYNASNGQLVITGSNIPTNTLVLSYLTLKVGDTTKLVFSSPHETISHQTATGFTVTLNATDRLLVNGSFNINGTSTGGVPYLFTAINGWDGNANDSIASQAVTVSGVGLTLSGINTSIKLQDISTVNPFSNIKVTDTNISVAETASISFTNTNGRLSGAGLSVATVANGVATYTLSTSSASALQLALQGLVFTPTAHQSAAGQTVNTIMTLSVNDFFKNNITNSNTQITITETPSPTLTQATYNVITGQLTITGTNLSSAMVLGELSLGTANYKFTLNSSTDSVSQLTATGLTVTLSASDQKLVNSFFNVNGTGHFNATYNLTASSGWDNSLNGSAANVGVTVNSIGLTLGGLTAQTTLTDTSTTQPFSSVTLTDNNTLAAEIASISFNAANGSLTGNGLSTAVINNGIAMYSLVASNVSALQQALQGIVFKPNAHQTTAGQSVSTTLTLAITDQTAYPSITLSQGLSPQGIVNDYHGNVWVTTSNNIEEFSGAGRLLVQQTLVANSLSIDNQNNVWLVTNNRVEELSSSGILLNTLSNSLTNPDSLVIDSQSNVWVSGFNGAIQEFSSTGVLLTSFSSGFSGGSNLTIDNHGNIWVNANHQAIEEFSATGVLLNTLTIGISSPISLTTDSQGNVWVANNATIEEFSASGSLLNTLAGVIANPVFLSTDRFGNLWVADTTNNRIEEFSVNGVLVKILTSGVSAPTSLSIDSQGNLWVANNKSVEKFLPTTLSNTVTNQSTQLTVTESAAPSLTTVIYNATTGQLNITGTNLSSAILLGDLSLSAGNQQFTLNSKSEVVSNLTATGLTVTLNAADQATVNNFFYSNGNGSTNVAYTLTASSGWDYSLANTTQVAVTVTGAGPILGGLTAPTALQDIATTQPFSTLTLTDSNQVASEIATISFTAANGTLSGSGLSAAIVNNGTVSYTLAANSATALQQELRGLMFAPNAHQAASGQTVSTAFSLSVTDQVMDGYNQSLLISQGISTPQNLTIDSQGNVWVINQGSLDEFSATGTLLHNLTGLSNPQNFTFDSQGNIWITNLGNYNGGGGYNSSLEEYSVTGTLLHNLTGLNQPQQLKIDSQGNVWVTNKNSLEEFSATGTLLHNLTGFAYPLTFDSQGNVWFFNMGGLEEFSATGTLILHNLTGLSNPQNFTFDSQGNVWVTNQYSLEEFSATGTLLHNLTGLSNPQNLTFDSQGNVWVINQGTFNGSSFNSSIEEFSATGTLLHNLTGLNQPQQLKIDSQGNIWVTNQNPNLNNGSPISYNSSLEEFSATGTLLHNLTGLSNPQNLTFDSQGNVWVTNLGTTIGTTNIGSLEEFSANGLLLNNLLSNPQNFTFDSQGNVWVISNNAIEKFSPILLAKNTLIDHSTQLTVTESAAPSLTTVIYNATTGQLNITGTNLSSAILLGDLTLSAGNQQFTLNPKSDVVSNLTATGLTVTLNAADQAAVNNFFYSNGNGSTNVAYTLTASSGWDYSLANTTQVAVTVTGAGPILGGLTALIALQDIATTQPFSTLTLTDSNQVASEIATISFTAANGTLSGSGLSAAIVNNGTVSYTLAANSATALQQELRGLMFTPTAHQVASGQTIKSLLNLTVTDQSTFSSPVDNITQGIANPNSLSFDSQGNVWVANNANNTIEKFSATGGLLSSLSNGINSPQSLTTDHQGNVWVANQGNWNGSSYNSTLEKFSTSGALLKIISTGIANPQSLATDSQNNVWVANQANNTVDKFSANGVLLNTLNTGTSTPNDLVTDNQGNVFVSFNTANGIANQSFIDEFSASGSLLNIFTNGINNPVNLATDSQGNLWVANGGGINGSTGNNQDGSIEKFSASGSLLFSLDTGLTPPIALACDSLGNVWIANQGVTNDTLEEFSVTGGLLLTVSTGIGLINSLSIDSHGNVWVADAGKNSVEEFVVNSTAVSNQTTQLTVTATANVTTVTPNDLMSNATVISSVHTGDSVIIADAIRFNGTAVTKAQVNAAGGDVTTLAGWITGAFGAKGGANDVSHGIDWFNFNGNTYLVEQANAQGTAYGTGDTLIQLVGIFNEQHASFSGHTLTLV